MFKAKRYSHTQTLTLNGAYDLVFPLFGPVLEKKWAAGWSPTLLHSETDFGDTTGSIFIAAHPGEPETIWYVNHFDTQGGIIEYLRITPGITLAVLEIRCQALSEMGNRRIDHLTHHHPQSVRDWEKAINYYLQTGETLPHPLSNIILCSRENHRLDTPCPCVKIPCRAFRPQNHMPGLSVCCSGKELAFRMKGMIA
jgi:hypothetical protein